MSLLATLPKLPPAQIQAILDAQKMRTGRAIMKIANSVEWVDREARSYAAGKSRRPAHNLAMLAWKVEGPGIDGEARFTELELEGFSNIMAVIRQYWYGEACEYFEQFGA